MTNPSPAIRLAAVAALGLAIPVHAAVFLTATFTGSFDAASTLDGTQLGSDTAFSITANFDPSVNFATPGVGEGRFQVESYTLTLGGNEYVGIPDGSEKVYAQLVGGLTYAGFIKGDFTEDFYAGFATRTPSFNAESPTPAAFTDCFYKNSSAFYHFALAGVPGGFTVNNFGSTTPTFTITQVPEPMETAAAIGIGLVAFAGWRRRKV